jgi:hypothetical protein
MSLQFSSALTVIQTDWTELKEIVSKKRLTLLLQFDDDGAKYTIFTFDASLAHVAVIWKGEVPDGVARSGYSQATNDADKADFETNYKARANDSIVRRTADGRPMVQPVTVDRDLWHWFTSAGDDPSLGRASGTVMEAALSAEGDSAPVEWQFNDWADLAGGVLIYEGAKLGDYISFQVDWPASVAANTPGAGNANKVPVPGGNLFVPAVNGDWTLTLNSRTSVVPVLSPGKKGYWEWDWPDEGVGNVSAGPPGASAYNLLDFAVAPATRFMPRVGLLGSRVMSFRPDNVHPTSVLPHWKMRAVVHHGPGTHALEVTWHIVCARKNTR